MIAFGGRRGPHRSGSRCRGRPIERREAGREGCLWPNAASQGRPPDGSGGESERSTQNGRAKTLCGGGGGGGAHTNSELPQAGFPESGEVWHNLQLVHQLEDYRGARTINRFPLLHQGQGGANPGGITGPKQTYSCIDVHGTRILRHVLPGSRRPVERCEQPDRPVATRVRGRGRTGGDGLTAYAYCRVGPLHRETAWLGVGLRAD